MVLDLIRAVCAAIAVVLLPGYFWAVLLRPAGGLGERLAYSSAVSLAAMPVVALVLEHLARTGITVWIALVSAFIVLLSGAAAVRWKGAAPGPAGPVLPRPAPITDLRALTLLVLALVGVLVSVMRPGLAPRWAALSILALLVLAVVLAGTGGPQAQPKHALDAPDTATLFRGPALAVVLAATAVRGYEPVLRYDWPQIRGTDHFSHAAMAEQMLVHGSYPTYLIYPPGFPAISAVLSRLSGLPPLTLYPVVAPMLLVLTALAAYALATRLWGWRYGIIAAALAGLMLQGDYGGLMDGRYPDLISAYFLITMGAAALIALYQAPSPRSAVLAAVLGASPVLYHSVATLYAALLTVLAAVTALPYLWHVGRRAEARLVLLALVGQTLLATCYAWYTYGIGWPVLHHSASSQAVSMALGSQPPAPPLHVLVELTPSIVWLGVLGLALLALVLRHRPSPPQVLAVVTVLGWCGLMYVGSRTAADGFPQRFERDLGAPLSVAGALGIGVLAASAWAALQRARLAPDAVAAASVAGLAAIAVTACTADGIRAESRPTPRLLSESAVTALTWLGWHNSGGTIVSTGMNDGITERAVLAMGGYAGLMYYGAGPLTSTRSLPPAGRKPLIEGQEVLERPASCVAARVITSEDVRYVVLYRGDSQDFDRAAFSADRARYREVFADRAVTIYATQLGPCRVGKSQG
ncbi:MAG TPA: hypothetical protein VIK57_21115 [Streptosporangiaceae bacterium]